MFRTLSTNPIDLPLHRFAAESRVWRRVPFRCRPPPPPEENGLRPEWDESFEFKCERREFDILCFKVLPRRGAGKHRSGSLNKCSSVRASICRFKNSHILLGVILKVFNPSMFFNYFCSFLVFLFQSCIAMSLAFGFVSGFESNIFSSIDEISTTGLLSEPFCTVPPAAQVFEKGVVEDYLLCQAAIPLSCLRQVPTLFPVSESLAHRHCVRVCVCILWRGTRFAPHFHCIHRSQLATL